LLFEHYLTFFVFDRHAHGVPLHSNDVPQLGSKVGAPLHGIAVFSVTEGKGFHINFEVPFIVLDSGRLDFIKEPRHKGRFELFLFVEIITFTLVKVTFDA